MFSFLSKKKIIQCPLDEHTQLWLEYAFMQLVDQYGEDRVKSKQVILPNTSFFPHVFDGSVDSLFKTASIVAEQMEVDINKINLQLYTDATHAAGTAVYTNIDKSRGRSLSAGLYFGKDEKGKYDIFIERSNLAKPENLVAVLAHGFARVILLKGMRTGSNLGILSDLSTVMYGLGIFNANASLQTYKGFDGWAFQSIGYLKQPHWGYALALYTYYRGEENPNWAHSLSPGVRSDFKRCEKYMLANTDKVFLQPYKQPDKTAEDELFSGRWYGYYQYGKGYTEKYSGKFVPFILDMEVTGGLLLGTCTEENLKEVFADPAFIEGNIENSNIFFTLTYSASWNMRDDNTVKINEGRPSQKVLYSGYFKNNEFAGDWKIESLRRDRDGVYYDHVSSGSWGMKRDLPL